MDIPPVVYPLTSGQSFIIGSLTLRIRANFELNFVFGIRWVSKFTFLHANILLSYKG